jgi:predicted ester cyclase
MSTEENKALAQCWIEEAWNKGDLTIVEELIAPNYILHDPARPGLRGREGIKQSVAMFRTAFPDLHFTIEDQIAEGDKVVILYTVQGPQGSFDGYRCYWKARHPYRNRYLPHL